MEYSEIEETDICSVNKRDEMFQGMIQNYQDCYAESPLSSPYNYSNIRVAWSKGGGQMPLHFYASYTDWFHGVPVIDHVIFNDPATIVFWTDGTKTVVKCQDDDVYIKETGLALCFMKKLLGNKSGRFNRELRKWCRDGSTEAGD